MQRWNRSRTMVRFLAVGGVLAGALTLLGCGGGAEAPAQVVATDTVIPINNTSVQALAGQTFSFASGEALDPGLANQPITVTFTNTAAATPTFTVTAPNLVGTDGQPARATGTTAFGSCTVSVTASTYAAGPPPQGPQVGQTRTVDPCSINAATGGVHVNTGTIRTLFLSLGVSRSTALNATIRIDSATGEVTINNVNTGQTVTLQIHTGTGGVTP